MGRAVLAAGARAAGARKAPARHRQALPLARTISTPTAPGSLSSFSMVTLTAAARGWARQWLATSSAKVSTRLIWPRAMICFDAFDDGVVVEGAADIVVERDAGGQHVDIDGEAHALGDALLMRVDADLDVEHEVVHEDAVEGLGLAPRELRRGPPQSLFHDPRLRYQTAHCRHP